MCVQSLTKYLLLNYPIMRLQNILILCFLCIATACDSGWVSSQGDILGVVIDEKSGQTISGARIRLMYYTNEQYETLSGENGEYLIEMADLNMTYDVCVEKRGYMPFSSTIDVPPSNDPFVFDVYMTPVEVPIVSTLTVSNITTKGATFTGRLENDGGMMIIEKGFYIGRDRKNCFRVLVPIDSKSFTCSVNNMDGNTQYGFAAFANNGIYEGEGEWITFATK